MKTLKEKKKLKKIYLRKGEKKFFTKYECCLHTCSAEEEQQWPAGNGKELAQMSNISAAPDSPILLPWSDRRGGRGRGRDGHGHTRENELRAPRGAPDSEQTPARASAEKESTSLARGQAAAQLAMGCSQGGSWCQPMAVWHCKGHQSLSHSTAGWAKGGLLHRAPRAACAAPNLCPAAPVPALSTIPSSGWHRAQPDSAQTRSELHTHPHPAWARGSCAQKQQQSTENWNNKCLQRAAHGQSSSYRLIKEKN